MGLGAAPPLELVRDGCGRGWHRTRWRDQWGIWHWGDCVPDEGRPYGGYGAGPYYPPSLARRPSALGLGVPVLSYMRAEPPVLSALTLRQANQARDDFAAVLDAVAEERAKLLGAH